jgi:CBS domain-containing protein
MVDAGTRVEHVTHIMSSVADAITQRLIGLAEAELGAPPAAYAFIALGSTARGEQTLDTDQDNAIIYADPADTTREATHAYFLRLGDRICTWLAQAGYRRCKGEVMACNPKWCQPLSQWRNYFTACITAAEPQDLLDVNVFFDFRCLHGEASFVSALRDHLRDIFAADRPAFFFHLAQSTLQFKPPRGFFGNIQLESATGERAPSLNIKTAITPLVNFARVYAVRHHITETHTLDRLKRLRDQGVLAPSSHDELVHAYTALMQMRLAHQVVRVSHNALPDNLIEITELTHIERTVLKKVFADIAVFQARLETDFARTA